MTIPEGERLAKVEQKLEDVCNDIGEIKKTLNTFIQSADDKYTAKWVEKTYLAFLVTAATSLLGIFIYLLERHIL